MQEEQRALVDQAQKMPGVVELAKLYERVESFDRYNVNPGRIHITYGVGVNG